MTSVMCVKELKGELKNWKAPQRKLDGIDVQVNPAILNEVGSLLIETRTEVGSNPPRSDTGIRAGRTMKNAYTNQLVVSGLGGRDDVVGGKGEEIHLIFIGNIVGGTKSFPYEDVLGRKC